MWGWETCPSCTDSFATLPQPPLYFACGKGWVSGGVYSCLPFPGSLKIPSFFKVLSSHSEGKDGVGEERTVQMYLGNMCGAGGGPAYQRQGPS